MALLMPRSSAAAAARPRADVIIHVKAKDGFKEVGQPDDKDKAASDSYYTLSATPLCNIRWIRMESASKASGWLCFTLRTATVSWRRVAPVCGWLFVLQVTANGHLDEVQELAKLSSSGERPCT